MSQLKQFPSSKNVIHLHGELRKVRSVSDESLITYTEDDIQLGDLASDGHQLIVGQWAQGYGYDRSSVK